MEFERKEDSLKLQDLHKLQMLQIVYCGVIDIQIETRKDQAVTMVKFCNYLGDFVEKSKLYIYKLPWYEDNSKELDEIEQDLKMLYKKY